MRNLLRVLCLVLVASLSFTACEDKSGGEGGEEAAKGTDAMTLFAGAKPTLPKVFADAGFSWGTTKDDAAKIEGWEHKPVISHKKDDASFNPTLTLRAGRGAPDEGVDRMRVVFPKDKPMEELKAALEKGWGPAMKAKHITYKDVDIWLNPEAGIKAMLHKDEWAQAPAVSFFQYRSLESILGTDKAKMGFETDKPLLGIMKDDYVATYNEWLHPMSKAQKMAGPLMLLPTEHQFREVNIAPTFQSDKLKEYNFQLRTDGTPEGQAVIEVALEKKYGKPTAEGEAQVYNTDPRVVLEKGVGETVKITVSPKPEEPVAPAPTEGEEAPAPE